MLKEIIPVDLNKMRQAFGLLNKPKTPASQNKKEAEMKNAKFIVISVIVFLICVISVFAQETLTITTYYPSPYGSYNQLQTNSFGVGDNDDDGGLDSGDVPTTAGEVWIDGKVGIGTGTTGPSMALDIRGDGTNNVGITFSNTNYGNNVKLYWDYGNGEWWEDVTGRGWNAMAGWIRLRIGYGLAGTGALDIYDDVYPPNSLFHVDEDGDVGIGTASPGSVPLGFGTFPTKLDIVGNLIRLRGNSTGDGGVGDYPVGLALDEDSLLPPSPVAGQGRRQAGVSLWRQGDYRWGLGLNSDDSFFIWNDNDGFGLYMSRTPDGVTPIGTRVGIGTVSPTGPTTPAPAIFTPKLHVLDSNTTNVTSVIIDNPSVTPRAGVVLTNGLSRIANFAYDPSGVYINSTTTRPLIFFTSNLERMRITSGGYVGIGITPSYPLHMSSGAYCTPGGIWTNGSSREYKENIRELTTEEATSTLEKLNPIKFNYKIDKEDEYLGFIAEDVPGLVATKDRKGLSAMDIVAVLAKVIQEQQLKIAALEKKVMLLEK